MKYSLALAAFAPLIVLGSATTVEVGSCGAGKDKTIVTGDVNREDLGNGAHRDTANIGISHKAGKHTVSGDVYVDKTKIPGVGSNKQVGVNAEYEFKPNKNTHINIGVSHTKSSGGKDTNVGINFKHGF